MTPDPHPVPSDPHRPLSLQAGPGCPPKPLLQSPVLRTAEGVPTPLGLRFSGL